MLRRNLIGLVAGLLLLAPGCAADVAQAYRNHLPTEPVAATPGALVIDGYGYELYAAANVTSAAAKQAWAGVLATLNRYLAAGVLEPLRSGGRAGDLGPLFTAEPGARLSASQDDRAAFVDEGLPPASDIRKDAAVASLSALAGQDGVVSVVRAHLDLRLEADIDGAPVTIARTGELILVPEGSVWKIDAYDLRVTRDSAAARTTTTARSS